MASIKAVLRLLLFGAVSALLTALGVRLLDLILGLRPRPGDATDRDIESAEETRAAYEAERIELDRTVLPGISIRS
jgi:hypothetical protein